MPRLRLHRLKGKHADKYAVSLTYSCRIVLFLRIEADEIVLLDVGSYDDVSVRGAGASCWERG